MSCCSFIDSRGEKSLQAFGLQWNLQSDGVNDCWQVTSGIIPHCHSKENQCESSKDNFLLQKILLAIIFCSYFKLCCISR